MSTMLDIIGSLIIVGIVLLAVLGLNVNLNQASYNKTFTLATQTNTVTLARMMESDLVKIGYHFPTHSILAIKSDSIAFKGDLRNSGTVNSVQYYLGSTAELSFTKNPRDRMIYRVEDGKTSAMNLGVTSLSFAYYDANELATSVPDSVRSVLVKFTTESPEPVDTSYASAFWQKKIYPKNLWIGN